MGKGCRFSASAQEVHAPHTKKTNKRKRNPFAVFAVLLRCCAFAAFVALLRCSAFFAFFVGGAIYRKSTSDGNGFTDLDFRDLRK